MKKYYKIFKIGFDTYPADYCYNECCNNLTLLQVGDDEYETEEDAENAIANLLQEGKCEEYTIVKCYKKKKLIFK